MRQFDVPEFYRSPLISKIKAKRKLNDPRKKDFTPFKMDIGPITFIIPRHFGFCYGVENAIEKSYKAIAENPNKRIFLLSQMIHNPDVNEDLEAHGLKFIQDTTGNQLIPFSDLNQDDIVIIPAFGTSLEIEEKLKSSGVNIDSYNTTCPFVEKVWNRSDKLGSLNHTVIIHGKANHEETRATFSHSSKSAKSLIIKDLNEAKVLAQVILGELSQIDFEKFFKDKFSPGFDVIKDLIKIGIVNQTTMLASETQEITDFLRSVMIRRYGEANIKNHIADTRDTLCYATNDNQTSTLHLLNEEADLAVVIGGFNSSNTTHLVEILEQKFETVFIRSEKDIIEKDHLIGFDIHEKSIKTYKKLLTKENDQKGLKIIITSGASCPDAIVEGVIDKLLNIHDYNMDKIELLNSI